MCFAKRGLHACKNASIHLPRRVLRLLGPISPGQFEIHRIFLTLCVLHLGKSSTLRRILLAILVIYELCMQGKKAKKLTVNDLSRRSGVGLEFLQWLLLLLLLQNDTNLHLR